METMYNTRCGALGISPCPRVTQQLRAITTTTASPTLTFRGTAGFQHSDDEEHEEHKGDDNDDLHVSAICTLFLTESVSHISELCLVDVQMNDR
jgi:hypothetical protein